MGIQDKIMRKAGGDKLQLQILKVLPKLLEVFESIHAQNEVQTYELIRARIEKDFPDLNDVQIDKQVVIELKKHQERLL
jgi:hypothetical protein